MKLRTTLTAISLVLSLGATAQAADRFGAQGTFAVGIDRVFGLTHTWTEADGAIAGQSLDVTRKYTNLTLGYNQTSSPYSNARVAFDLFLLPGFSIGGAAGYITSNSDVRARAGDVDREVFDFTTEAYLLAPRVGIALVGTGGFGIWPRGGITYINARDRDGANDGDVLALTLEAPLVLSPAPNVAFLIGPTFDWGVTGELRMSDTFRARSIPDDRVDATVREIGLQAGLVAYF
jgi:hypothetical protein